MNNALKTWYPKDNPKHYDFLHPALKLAGETGELIDLIAKGMFKPGYDIKAIGKDGLPLLDSELGDWLYYQRILQYLEASYSGEVKVEVDKVSELLVELNYRVAEFVYTLLIAKYFNHSAFVRMAMLYQDLLRELGAEYDDILQQNYWKLNEKDDTQHGWKDAK